MQPEKLRGLIVKFCSNEYLSNNASGNFFFKNISFFRHLEAHENRGIKDPDEVTQVLNFKKNVKKVMFLSPTGELTVMDNPQGTLKQTYSNTNMLSICCFAFLSLDEDFHRNTSNEFTLKESVFKELLSEFPDKSGVIWPAGDFANLTSNFDVDDDKIQEMTRGKVKYYSKTNSHPEDFAKNNFQEMKRIAFSKENYFKNQREFRLLAICTEKNYDFSCQSLFKPA